MRGKEKIMKRTGGVLNAFEVALRIAPLFLQIRD